MAEYEVTRSMPAPVQVAFDVAADVDRAEDWLPTTVDVRTTAPNVIEVEGETRSGHRYLTTGLFRAQRHQLRLEWGSSGSDDYSGWMQFYDRGDGTSEANLHLSFRGDQPQARTHGEWPERTEQEMREALDRLADQVQRRAAG